MLEIFIYFISRKLHAQDSTPIVSFEFTRDNYYENQIKKLKESINKNNELNYLIPFQNLPSNIKIGRPQ